VTAAELVQHNRPVCRIIRQGFIAQAPLRHALVFLGLPQALLGDQADERTWRIEREQGQAMLLRVADERLIVLEWAAPTFLPVRFLEKLIA